MFFIFLHFYYLLLGEQGQREEGKEGKEGKGKRKGESQGKAQKRVKYAFTNTLVPIASELTEN